MFRGDGQPSAARRWAAFAALYRDTLLTTRGPA